MAIQAKQTSPGALARMGNLRLCALTNNISEGPNVCWLLNYIVQGTVARQLGVTRGRTCLVRAPGRDKRKGRPQAVNTLNDCLSRNETHTQ